MRFLFTHITLIVKLLIIIILLEKIILTNTTNDYERHKRALNLIIAGIEEKNYEATLEIVKEKLTTKYQIQTNYCT